MMFGRGIKWISRKGNRLLVAIEFQTFNFYSFPSGVIWST
jgi:hypothetical protein